MRSEEHLVRNLAIFADVNRNRNRIILTWNFGHRQIMGGAQVGHAHINWLSAYAALSSFIATGSIDRGMPWRKESTVLVTVLFLLPIITAEVSDNSLLQ